MKEFLYRFISFEAFVGMVQSQTLTFVLPETWDDPKESAPFQQLIVNTDDIYSKILLLTVYNKTYGQCWTRTSESDAMWRIYSYNNRAIRIKTTEDKLKLLPDVQMIRVEYSDQINLSGLSIVDAFLKSLAIKRCAFSHENEVRLIKHYKFADSEDAKQHIKAFLAAHEHPQMIDILDSLFPNLSPEDQAERVVQLLNIGNTKRKTLNVPFESIPEFIEGVKVHPLASAWYVDVVSEYCRRNCIPFEGKSTLYSAD